ncbi:MAG: ComEC/Rec2 family competence protein, partial [Mucilaginibacter sp.]
ISMVIIGKTYSKAISTLNILAVSAFFLLLYDPLFITDVGFQLSYLAVAGLIIFQPIVYKWFHFKKKWADKLWLLCSVSIAAQVITFPLSAFYFHQFPVYFLVSNLFIIIPSAIIMYSGIAYLLFGSIPILGDIFGFILEKSILIMDRALVLIEQAPWSGISKIWLTTTEYLLLYGIIISVFYFLYNKRTWLLQLSLVFTLLFATSISIKRWKNLEADGTTVFNIKKHNCIVVRRGTYAAVVTDLSDTDKIFKYSVQPFLDSCQVSNIQLYKFVRGSHSTPPGKITTSQ